MSEDLGRRVGRAAGRQLGRRAASRKSGAELALAEVEAFPEALPGPVAEVAVAARRAARRQSATACWRKRHRAGGGQAEASDFVGAQTLKVRPQPGRAWRLLQKMRRARRVLRLGLASSKPYRKPWRIRAPTTLQCGQGVSLRRRQWRAIPRCCGKTSVARPRRHPPQKS